VGEFIALAHGTLFIPARRQRQFGMSIRSRIASSAGVAFRARQEQRIEG
jgi:hypothetical protein